MFLDVFTKTCATPGDTNRIVFGMVENHLCTDPEVGKMFTLFVVAEKTCFAPLVPKNT